MSHFRRSPGLGASEPRSLEASVFSRLRLQTLQRHDDAGVRQLDPTVDRGGLGAQYWRHRTVCCRYGRPRVEGEGGEGGPYPGPYLTRSDIERLWPPHALSNPTFLAGRERRREPCAARWASPTLARHDCLASGPEASLRCRYRILSFLFRLSFLNESDGSDEGLPVCRISMRPCIKPEPPP